MKFCRNCGEQLPDVGASSAETVTGTALPPPDSAHTVAGPAVAPPKPPPEALKTVVGQAVAPPKLPPEAFKTVVAQAVAPPPEAFKTKTGAAVPPSPGNAPSPPHQATRESAGLEDDADATDHSGNRFVYFILALALFGFIAGLAIFFAVYVFSEKPRPAPAVIRTGAELLDASIQRIELCSFRTLPKEPSPFDPQTVANAFPSGIRAVAARISGQPRPDGDYRVVWRQVELPAPLMAQSIQSFAATQQATRLLYQPDGKPLATGAYVVEIQDGDRPLGRAYFTIGLAADQR